MLPLFRRRAPATACCLLLSSLLTDCSRQPAPPPVLSSWSEQFAAMERAVQQKAGSDLVLVSGDIMPVRERQSAPGEPIELRSTFLFVSPRTTYIDNEGKPRHPGVIVHYKDHHLATTLSLDDEMQTIVHADPKAGEAARLIRLSPQDVLQLTLAEGQPFLKEPVNAGNIVIDLVRVYERPPDVKALAVWEIAYYGDSILSLWVDAQTGAILKRTTEQNK